ARAKDRYDEAYRAAGHGGRPSLRIMRWVHVAESDEEARAGARPWLFKMLQLFTGLSRPGVEPDNAAYAELTSVALGGRFGTWTYDEMIANDLAQIGGPAQVATQLVRQQAA